MTDFLFCHSMSQPSYGIMVGFQNAKVRVVEKTSFGGDVATVVTSLTLNIVILGRASFLCESKTSVGSSCFLLVSG